MLFNSTEFLFLFLPVVLLVFIYLARTGNTNAQINWLILASIVFYGSWNPLFILLIVFSLVVNFFIGRLLAPSRENARSSTLLVAGVLFNLALLGYFKYAGFFVENLNALGLWLIPMPEIVLPLAISFFTFQQIAYLVDVSRGECEEYEFRHYALFVLFFPQLIAGPIVHHREMMPQFESLRRGNELWRDLSVGLTIMSIGLFKKVVLADSLGQYADPLYDAAGSGVPINAVDSWIATLSFSFQIYFDFSGYSDIAIGSARLFGIRLPENFRSPYRASSIIDIWRRWHMTLSRFLRDYLYIALGGNRYGRARRYCNLVITMLLGGLWHGAAWTFVVWGAAHGFYLCVNHAWRALVERFGWSALGDNKVVQLFYIGLTFMAWSLAMVVFRSSDLTAAAAIMTPGFTPPAADIAPILNHTITESSLGQFFGALGLKDTVYLPVYSLLALCACICWAFPNTQEYMRQFEPVLGDKVQVDRHILKAQWQPGYVAACVVASLLSFSILSLSSVSEFIYFRF